MEMMSYNFLVIFFVSQLKFYTKPRTFYSPGFHLLMGKGAIAYCNSSILSAGEIVFLGERW